MSVSVLGIGDLVIDVILGPVADIPGWGEEVEVDGLDARLGGNLGNFAVAARTLGMDVQCAGPVGSDDYGTRVRQELEAMGCGVDHVRAIPGEATCISVGVVRQDGERLFVTHPGALRKLGEFIRDLAPPVTEVAFVSGWCQPPRVDAATLLRLFAILSRRDTRIVMDLSWLAETWRRKADLLDVLRRVDFAMLNSHEMAAIVSSDNVAEGLERLTAALGEGPAVVVKCGAEGAAAKRGRGPTHRTPAPPASASSAVGAGDNFNAAFIAATFDRHLELAAAVRSASDFASRMMAAGDHGRDGMPRSQAALACSPAGHRSSSGTI